MGGVCGERGPTLGIGYRFDSPESWFRCLNGYIFDPPDHGFETHFGLCTDMRPLPLPAVAPAPALLIERQVEPDVNGPFHCRPSKQTGGENHGGTQVKLCLSCLLSDPKLELLAGPA